jgi:hypothetical protein
LITVFYRPSSTSTGNLNLSKAPFFNVRFPNDTLPAKMIVSQLRTQKTNGQTCSDPIIHLIHIQVDHIRGKDAIEQLQISLLKTVDCLWDLKRTTFRTSLPGSNHHIVV